MAWLIGFIAEDEQQCTAADSNIHERQMKSESVKHEIVIRRPFGEKITIITRVIPDDRLRELVG